MCHVTACPKAMDGEDSLYIWTATVIILKNAIVDIQHGAVLQLGGWVVGKFLAVKIWDVKNCYIRS
jgi:hypothetical protein